MDVLYREMDEFASAMLCVRGACDGSGTEVVDRFLCWFCLVWVGCVAIFWESCGDDGFVRETGGRGGLLDFGQCFVMMLILELGFWGGFDRWAVWWYI